MNKIRIKFLGPRNGVRDNTIFFDYIEAKDYINSHKWITRGSISVRVGTNEGVYSNKKEALFALRAFTE
jgi:hypothetical protein